mmetsp:Transcript_58661/g.136428  ORF Transcript_58661/g.136428 Transcript_58661/m.136428 type:complete len:123 (-) Transcript_58661:109-477(-)
MMGKPVLGTALKPAMDGPFGPMSSWQASRAGAIGCIEAGVTGDGVGALFQGSLSESLRPVEKDYWKDHLSEYASEQSQQASSSASVSGADSRRVMFIDNQARKSTGNVFKAAQDRVRHRCSI